MHCAIFGTPTPFPSPPSFWLLLALSWGILLYGAVSPPYRLEISPKLRAQTQPMWYPVAEKQQDTLLKGQCSQLLLPTGAH